ncbi:TPA: pilus assembly protein [Candidatus Delongbacteria bacterium]|nr:MAG: hypothetical protein A2Y39_05400 [Candidatus Delongbacteria bacterium GWF2_40_14]HAQ62001.1 pilus assembly protein [Candidatus Delongbacteria bacterium]
MIIADTSIWIDFFRNKLEERQILMRLIEDDLIIMPDVVAGELLQGAKSEKEVRIIKGYAQNLKRYSELNLFVESGEYSFRNKLIDKGIGLIDSVFITTAIKTNSKIWTNDLKLIKHLNKELIYIPGCYIISD